MLGQVKNLEMSVSIDMLSPKQLICDCLDLTSNTIKELLSLYYHNTQQNNPFSNDNQNQNQNQQKQQQGLHDFNKLISTIT